MKNNANNNGKQRGVRKLSGGVTGKGFQPGQSGNPTGRPRTRGLVSALKAAVSQVLPNGQTVEEIIADVLIDEALNGKRRVVAINSIYDRIEGRPKQSIDVNEKRGAEALSKLTDDELIAEIKEKLASFEADRAIDASSGQSSEVV
jgi:hypothetical protein